MSKKIHKSLQKYVSKITNSSNKQIQFPIPCNRPKTASFAIDTHKHQNDAATLSDIDQFLYENFKSLYQNEHQNDAICINNDSKTTSSSLFDSPKLLDPPPPRENLRGSSRFFVSSGSSSSQIIDEASTSSSSAADRTAEEIDPTAADDFIALLTYSPSPYEDFRMSMEEMVEARSEQGGSVDWGFLEELLFCYLDLNNRKAYRFILRAFVDLIVVLREGGGAGESAGDEMRSSASHEFGGLGFLVEK